VRVVQEKLFAEKRDVRKLNIMKSPKRGGSCDVDSLPYLGELGVSIVENKRPIQFTPNINELIHRWAPYVQGFSASFVQSVLDRYSRDYEHPVIFDPFAGCGTVLVQAKLNGFKSLGVEINPLLHFLADTKLNCWDVSAEQLLKVCNSMPRNRRSQAPTFLKSSSHFSERVLRNLEIIKGGIESIKTGSDKCKRTNNLMKLAFASILVDCSKLKRTPCLGYWRSKRVHATAPFVLLNKKIHEIADDLRLIRSQYKDFIRIDSEITHENAMHFKPPHKFDLVITSPPYMNGLDYVMNYKIEMGWLGFAISHKELKKIKDDMVVCDNVSKGLIRDFQRTRTSYTNEWIEEIKSKIEKNIIRRGAYRRKDMPYIVHKYFDDLYRVMKNITPSLNHRGRFIMVIGDSLIADVYIPTDLLIAKMGLDLGLRIEQIERARDRRSGQIRSYKLRETVITLQRR